MSDEGRKRPRFEDAATLISEPPVIRPGTGQPQQPQRTFGPPPGAPSTDTAETETRVDGPRGVDQPIKYATPVASPAAPSTEDGATRLNMKAVQPAPLGVKTPSAVPRFYGKGPHELRGEPVATPIDHAHAQAQAQAHAHPYPPPHAHGAQLPGVVSHIPALPPTPQAGMGHPPAVVYAPGPSGGHAGHPPGVKSSASGSTASGQAVPDSGRGNFRVVPVEGTNPDGRLVLVHDPDGSPSQQYRLVKFKLKERGDPRCIAVTCAKSGEGSTTLAANLALALAEGRRTRVALLEANFRSPALAQAFGLSVPSGLTEEIRAHRKDPDAPWSVLELGTGFHLLPCGKPADNPAALLNSEEFARLMQELRLYYDFVIVDTPAVLAAADINIVQDLVDGVVVAARSGRSSGPALRKAVSRLSTKNLTGVVLIGTS